MKVKSLQSRSHEKCCKSKLRLFPALLFHVIRSGKEVEHLSTLIEDFKRVITVEITVVITVVITVERERQRARITTGVC